MSSFSDLRDLHKEMDGLFLSHQRALLRLDLRQAALFLDAFEAELLAHMRDEEELMIPLYRERVEAPVGGAVEIFLADHEKMRQYVILMKEEVERLETAEDLEAGVLFLLDSQHLFKRLLAHHDTRETKMLYPLLDQATTEVERQKLFERCNARTLMSTAA
jgi:iron-sulfur cluster repair protein YtfE (RIC family)